MDGLLLSEGQLAVSVGHGLTVTLTPANQLANVCARVPGEEYERQLAFALEEKQTLCAYALLTDSPF